HRPRARADASPRPGGCAGGTLRLTRIGSCRHVPGHGAPIDVAERVEAHYAALSPDDVVAALVDAALGLRGWAAAEVDTVPRVPLLEGIADLDAAGLQLGLEHGVERDPGGGVARIEVGRAGVVRVLEEPGLLEQQTLRGRGVEVPRRVVLVGTG